MTGERMDREQRAQRGAHAKRLLEDPLLNEALDTEDAAVVAEWREATDTKAREEAWAVAHALTRVRLRLRSYLADGQYAQAHIERNADK